MNKLVYVLTLGVAAVAITITTTVATETGISFGGATTQQTIDAIDEVSVTSEVINHTATEDTLTIEDTTGTTIGTMTTTTTIDEDNSGTVVDSAEVTVTGDLTEKTEA